MAKKAYYFSHDAGARNDPKMLALRAEWGVEGYGYYMIILEMMREQSEFMLEHCASTTRALSYEFRVDSDKVETFINDCVDVGLFRISEDYIWSESFVKRMEKMTGEAVSRTKRAKKAANTRWNNQNDAKPMLKQCSSNADAMLNDANKIRLNEIRLNEIRLEEKSVVDKSPTDTCPYQEIIDLFHKHCPKLPTVKKITSNRKKKIKARWTDFDKNTLVFEQCFCSLSCSSWHNGGNDRGWKADIDWIMRSQENMMKFLEVDYCTQQAKTPNRKLTQHERNMEVLKNDMEGYEHEQY